MTQQGRVQKSVGSKGPKSRMSWTRLDHNPSEPEPEPARQWSRLNKNQNHSWTATQGEQNLAGTEPKNEKESTRDQKQSGTRNTSSLPLHTKKVTITMWTTKEQHVAISHCPIRALWSTPTNRWSSGATFIALPSLPSSSITASSFPAKQKNPQQKLRLGRWSFRLCCSSSLVVNDFMRQGWFPSYFPLSKNTVHKITCNYTILPSGKKSYTFHQLGLVEYLE